ncbi:hypothetical protein PUN28_007516 [Cardiocondyla obscurior]|uniref:Uncharacterized protein n=1 Tax=Cardiocondyla obscurior TaxID=286306 RepID=A0AAW2G6L8_9HYME
MEKSDCERISGLSKSNLPMRSERPGGMRGGELMDQIEERELHFNVSNVYVKAFGFHWERQINMKVQVQSTWLEDKPQDPTSEERVDKALR